MKIIVLIVIAWVFPISDFAQVDHTDFQKTFNEVADTYEKNVKPYLEKFSRNQFKIDQVTPETERLINSYYRIYLQKTEELRRDGYAEISQKAKLEKITKEYLIGYFDLAYRVQFPGLDYVFYESCAEQLK